MVRFFYLPLVLGATVFACASRSGDIRDADAVAEIRWGAAAESDSAEDAAAVIKLHTVAFRIPNPLVGQGLASSRRVDPNHESQIYCRATLLDSIATEADITLACEKDSLDADRRIEFRRKYLEERTQPGRFRIRIAMESGFSPKSIDPAHWAMYIMNARGIMIEPAQIKTTPAISKKDSIYSSFHRMSLPRNLINGEIILYFDQVTFFKENLLGEENPFIALEMAHEKETVARVVWRNAGAIEKKDGGKDVRTQR